MKAWLAWLEERTGAGSLWRGLLYHSVPGGAGWRQVWGNTILFALAVEFVTGFFLWLAYSPSTQTAWESVFYIQHVVPGGAWLRGIHHFMADALVLLLGVHLLQMIVLGTYRAPREVNFWIALLLLLVVAGVALTGYLLPWDQHGYWGTKVRTGYLGLIPVVGSALQKLAIGGAEMGNLTLTRFFALHAGALPAVIVTLIVAQGWILHRQAGRGTESSNSVTPWLPDQALRDAVACLVVLGVVVGVAWRINLAGAPANPGEAFAAARPEWYFYFLYELLSHFSGGMEVVGAVVLPNVVLLVLFAMPGLARWRPGHRFNVSFVILLLAGGAALTLNRIRADLSDESYQRAQKQERLEAARVSELALADTGIPPTGAATLLQNDPLTQGPRLFARHCASCHRFDVSDGFGNTPSDPQSASELKGFASRAWLAGLLDPAQVDSTNYFGATKHREGKMVKFVKSKVANYPPAKQEELRKVIAAVSAEAGLKTQSAADTRDAALIAEGRQLLVDEMACTDCHQFRAPDDQATAPDLTGYGSRAWLIEFLRSPKHARFYGDHNDRMPSFGEDGLLDEKSLGLLADWLRGEWYEPSVR